VREQLKNLVTGSDVHELRFNLEQKHKQLEEELNKTKDNLNTNNEDVAELRTEVIKHENNINGCRKDLDKLRQEYNTSSSSLDYKLENLDGKVFYYYYYFYYLLFLLFSIFFFYFLYIIC
jgi:predicted  nucleic acid-binding Zn-ribbon protein